MRAVFVLLLLLVLPLGCGGGDAPGDDAASETPPTSEPDFGVEAPETITEADSGAAFTLAPGGTTALRLSSDYTWDEPFVGGEAVRLDRVDYLQDPGFVEWIVNAVEPGTVLITSTGQPQCPQGEDGCPDEQLDFQTRITVTE